MTFISSQDAIVTWSFLLGCPLIFTFNWNLFAEIFPAVHPELFLLTKSKIITSWSWYKHPPLPLSFAKLDFVCHLYTIPPRAVSVRFHPVYFSKEKASRSDLCSWSFSTHLPKMRIKQIGSFPQGLGWNHHQTVLPTSDLNLPPYELVLDYLEDHPI